MPRRRKRKRKQNNGVLWYLVQDGDILESSNDKSELISLCNTYKSLNTICDVVSQQKYNEDQKALLLRRRNELLQRESLIKSQDDSMHEALMMDNNKRKREHRENDEQPIQKRYKEAQIIEEEQRCKIKTKDEKRMEILESYKTLYPMAYVWEKDDG